MHESSTRSTLRISVSDDRMTTAVEPDEVLVIDPRAGLTPSQMVDQKLLALLRRRSGGRLQATTRMVGDIRRMQSGGP
jgi:hypothetical protein